QASVRKSGEKNTPQCALCEVCPRSALNYASHLRAVHKSTLSAIGIYLICGCGVEVRTDNRSTKHLQCKSHQFTVHKLIKTITLPTPLTPKCIFCIIHPTTTSTYSVHLKSIHKSTLRANEIYLL
ncbi:hypothetical protein PENTCL1PPCAC_12298, partial [Pristionchus entomophagus]